MVTDTWNNLIVEHIIGMWNETQVSVITYGAQEVTNHSLKGQKETKWIIINEKQSNLPYWLHQSTQFDLIY